MLRRWFMLMALATVAALFAGAHSNDAVLAQIQAANKWSYFQSKGVKSDVIAAKIDLLKSLDKPVSDKDRDRAAKLSSDKDGAEKEAHALEAKSDRTGEGETGGPFCAKNSNSPH